MTANVHVIYFKGHENVLKLDRDDGFTAPGIY